MTVREQTAFRRAMTGARRLARFEIAIAAACLLVPLFLIAFDSWNIRGSISAYWDMEQHQVFYFGLTVAAMLFIVRGARAERHLYSAGLGLALGIVILFNEEYWQPWHGIAAGLFFGGGVVAIARYSRGPWADKIKKPLLALAVGVILAWKPLGWISLFWAEWLAMFALAAHFAVHAFEEIRAETIAPPVAPEGSEEHPRPRTPLHNATKRDRPASARLPQNGAQTIDPGINVHGKVKKAW